MPDHLAHGFAACGQIGARIEGFGTLRKQGPDGAVTANRRSVSILILQMAEAAARRSRLRARRRLPRYIPPCALTAATASCGTLDAPCSTSGTPGRRAAMASRRSKSSRASPKTCGAVTRPDGNGKRIASGTGYKCFRPLRDRYKRIRGTKRFPRPRRAVRVRLRPRPPVMGVLHDASGDGHILLKRQV